MILKRLADLDVNSSLILIIRDFLRERPQRVCLNGFLSDSTVLSTGCPQGCCLSPILFSIYTDYMKCNTDFTCLLKFADDMALVGLLKEEESLSSYFEQANMLIKWCEDSFLHLNVKKTKELVINSIGYDKPCIINNESVEIVPYFKYLGTLIDSKCNFNENTNFIFKKVNQRLHLLRKLKHFNVNKSILETVYRSFIESLISYNITVWCGNLSVRNRNILSRVIRIGSKIVGQPQLSLEMLYHRAIKRKALSILSDPGHPLHSNFRPLPSGRRLRMPLATKNLYKKSFIPSAISLLNKY